MSGYCVCRHGFGQHQVQDPFHVRRGGEIVLFTDRQPLMCCDRDCECEEFVRQRARWRPARDGARVSCWIGSNGLPVCGKAKDRKPFSEEGLERWSYIPRVADRCAGCSRWLRENPEAIDPRVPMEVSG